MTESEKLLEILKKYEVFITYVPLRSEVEWREYCALPAGARTFEIPPRASLDPTQQAKIAVDNSGDSPTAILMPGRKFDTSGTRFGQGGGWYDRFLAEVPPDWIRIGFCYDYQFSNEPLVRQPWDQAMDYVCVIDKNTKELTLHEIKN